MNHSKDSRPSLKITRRVGADRGTSFAIEVWNPFTGTYQALDSIRQGLARVDSLANLIRTMWMCSHPKQDMLMDVPADPEKPGDGQWAEVRISGTTQRSYETRNMRRPGWVRAAGLTQAAAAICARVGYVPPRPDTP